MTGLARQARLTAKISHRGFAILGLALLCGCSLLPSKQNDAGITGWTTEGQPVNRGAGRQTQGVASAGGGMEQAYRDSGFAAASRTCQDLARTRASDAALNRSDPLDDSDLQQVYTLTYRQCMKWRGL